MFQPAPPPFCWSWLACSSNMRAQKRFPTPPHTPSRGYDLSCDAPLRGLSGLLSTAGAISTDSNSGNPRLEIPAPEGADPGYRGDGGGVRPICHPSRVDQQLRGATLATKGDSGYLGKQAPGPCGWPAYDSVHRYMGTYRDSFPVPERLYIGECKPGFGVGREPAKVVDITAGAHVLAARMNGRGRGKASHRGSAECAGKTSRPLRWTQNLSRKGCATRAVEHVDVDELNAIAAWSGTSNGSQTTSIRGRCQASRGWTRSSSGSLDREALGPETHAFSLASWAKAWSLPGERQSGGSLGTRWSRGMDTPERWLGSSRLDRCPV